MVNLKNISLDLQQFMKHSVTHLTNFQPNVLSPVSTSFISTLFHKIHHANIKWYEDNAMILNTKTNWPISHLPQQYNYIPELIRKTIESIKRETIFQHQFTLEIGNKTFRILIWFPTFIKTVSQSTILMSDIQIQEKVNRILQKIYIWLSIATSYIHKNTKCSKTVNIFLFLTEHTKSLPTNDNKIQQINVNTAFTTGCVNEHTNIFIYREEEWFKVFMHETMHNLGLDFIGIATNPELIRNKIYPTFPISVQDIRLYETYSELWANIMNILFVVYFTDIPAKKGRLPIVRWTQLFTKRLYLEQLFSLFQATKILIFHKMKYSDLFVVEKAQLYKEETHVFSYYILKSIWLLNINSFLEFCVSQKNGVSLKFHLSQPNLDKFIHILIKNAHNPLYIHAMNDMYHFYNDKIHSKINTKNIPFAKNTLRMTLQELC
jgi:hypothetical protein